MDLELTGRRVVVTGGSRGIGRAIAERFLREGARVMICARDEAALVMSARELSAIGEIHHRRADIADPADVDDLVAGSVETLGGLDILVSNVSAMGGSDFAASFAVDVEGANRLIRGCLAHLPDHAGANIVAIGSRAGGIGIPWMPAYAAVKAATVSMITSLALEVARRGIRANVVSPGDIEFPGGVWDRVRTEQPKLYDGVLRENPFRRLGRPEEIADVVAFVASPRASFMTGANVLVDGGASRHLQL